jgi:indolepyruvate ferredoxin oxidoreductase
LDADTTARIDAQLAVLEAKHNAMQVLEVKADRQPWFCSGCPHNTSTKVPEGSRAMAGIGCHFMSLWMDRSTTGFTQMGGEGVPWVGQQPFSNDQHIFANIGDGTYFHSGILAVRQSVAAGVNITYKILYNDAVAMTGGQPIGERAEGHSVIQIAQSMRAEGAMRIVIVTDEPEKYEPVGQNGVPGTLLGLPEGVAIEHRDDLDRVQRFMREIKGCTVIIYDQTCATEKRRRRKRGTMVDPAVRVVINEAVCEGCGDCSSQSNCLSVEPLETELGRKRSINQSTCNKDQSCVKGFCPSFVTVEGGQLRKKNKADNRRDPAQLGELPDPELPSLTRGVYPGGYGIVVAGVGGTGVITIGQLLGMAAHLEGKGIVTQDSAGLAQKGGATWSHVLIAQQQDEIRTTRVSTAAADLILGCDPIVTAGKETMVRMRPGRTRVAINGLATPTAAFVKNGAWANPSDSCLEDILQAVGNEPRNMGAFDANQVSTQLLGDSIFINPMVMGFAWQRGWIPLSQDAIMRAIELNGVQVEANKLAFTWGRWCAHDLAKVQALTQPVQVVNFKARESLQFILQKRMGWLEQYQDKAYAKQYMSFVQDVQQKTSAHVAEAVARNLYKLMAYKDEYEVARLHADPVFLQRIADQFEGDFTLNYHLAPPLISKKNDKGELVKQKFGPSMLTGFKLLSRLRFLRGGVFDVFGYTEERRGERALIEEYKASISEVMASFTPDKHSLALEIARIPEKIKGYGHVKERHLKAAREQWNGLLHAWRA